MTLVSSGTLYASLDSEGYYRTKMKWERYETDDAVTFSDAQRIKQLSKDYGNPRLALEMMQGMHKRS